MEEQNNSLWGVIKQYFNSLPDKNEERDTISQITDGISFKGSNLWILIFAILIASLGLNVNSTAVIIGAMLISPLMGPITGMGLSIGINDLQFQKLPCHGCYSRYHCHTLFPYHPTEGSAVGIIVAYFTNSL